jgi:sugar phosphate isomerase/epimerase
MVESAGLVVSSLQSILFQRPELQLFGSDWDRQRMQEHLCHCASLAADLGASCLVLGAPKNRNRGDLSEDDAFNIAAEFFRETGAYYADRGVCLGFEANPVQYGCNFATESKTAAQLVRTVNSKGFGLHLDIACMHLAGEDPVQAIRGNIDILSHFHASEPFLGSFGTPSASHELVARTLKEAHYHGWVALEMRAGESPLPALEAAAAYVCKIYGD